jgi:hypothetical protein
MNLCRLFTILLFVISSKLWLYSQPNESEKEFIKLFDSAEVIQMQLIFCFDSLFDGGTSEEKRYPATLVFNDDTLTRSIPIAISKRGHFRKSFNICDFPPLRFHFSEKYTHATLFEGINKIKLVTHCQNTDTLFDQYILQEFLLYKCYNLLTERSFKVRLARIYYQDNKHKHTPMLRWAFFIENPSDLAFRINGEVLNVKYLTPEAMEPYYYALMSLFQFMIINQDWSVNIAHNIEFIGVYPSLQPVTVPFDFDMADIIHVPYNSPLLSYRLEKKQERKFLPRKVDRRSLERALANMKNNRNEIKNVYLHNKYLSDTVKIKTLRHIDDFYTILDSKALLKKHIIQNRKK